MNWLKKILNNRILKRSTEGICLECSKYIHFDDEGRIKTFCPKCEAAAKEEVSDAPSG